MTDGRIVKLAVRAQLVQGLQGDIFDALPPHLTFEQITAIAADGKLWKKLGTCVGDTSAMQACIKDAEKEAKKKKAKKKRKVIQEPAAEGCNTT